MRVNARAVVAPILSSPVWLSLGGFFVILAVLAIQAASGIPYWRTFSPVELSSNLVATAGLAWALIQLRTYWRAAASRRAWALAGLGMALLATEGNVGALFGLEPHDPAEMGMSIAMWIAAAWLLFHGASRYAMRRSVMAVMGGALALQIVAQAIGWQGATGGDGPHAALLEYLNDTGELVAVLFYLAALLLAEFAPVKDYALPAEAVGRKGRLVFRDFGLRKPRSKYPTRVPFLQRPVARHIVLGVMVLMFGLRAGPQVRRAGGPSVARQLADLVRLAFQGIDAASYYVLGLYEAGPGAADGAVTRVETKNGLTGALQRAAGGRGEREMSDKLCFTEICEAAGLPVVPILATVGCGDRRPFAARQAFDRDLFVKDRKGCGGKFTLNFERVAPLAYRDDAGEIRTLDEIVAGLGAHGRQLVIQPKLKNHPSVAFLAEDSLVVFRVVTCLDAAGEPRVTHGVARILRRFEPTWPDFVEKEWGAAVDLETGALGPLAGDVAESCTDWRPDHPVTGARVLGMRIEAWPDVARAAVEAHRVFAARALIGWDIGLTPEGPVLLEGNSNMDFAFMQRCYRTPLGKSPLGPLMSRLLDELVSAQTRQLEVERLGARRALEKPAT